MEGTWDEIVESKLARLRGRRVRVSLCPVAADLGSPLTIALGNLCSRTPAQIEDARLRLLGQGPVHPGPPDGASVLDAIMGTWPGDETDQQVEAALQLLS